MLLQQRAETKYHSGGLWTNTCCSHPKPDESSGAAASRRLQEEMGFVCELIPVTTFIYRAELDHGLVEYEFDHVFIGTYDGEVKPNPQEVQDYTWKSTEDVEKDLREHPDTYTVWFEIILPKVFVSALTKNSLPV